LSAVAAAASSVREALDAAVEALRAAGVEDPRLDAEVMLAAATGWERAALVADPGADLPAAAGREFAAMVRRRLRREPVAYVLGRKGFRRLELEVDARVLVPRPETELLVELALELRPGRVLDVGTGSGAIALAVAEELPGCEVTATDTSPGALEVARTNAARLGLAERVRFQAGTLPEEGAWDLVLANLPYVAEPDWAGLRPEVREWEPREALLAGPHGLDAIRSLVGAVELFHRSGGQTSTAPVLGLEVGEGQAPAVAELLRGAGYREVEARRDLAGIERVVVGRA
jgi:release factor glutamine methyltransferase